MKYMLFNSLIFPFGYQSDVIIHYGMLSSWWIFIKRPKFIKVWPDVRNVGMIWIIFYMMEMNWLLSLGMSGLFISCTQQACDVLRWNPLHKSVYIYQHDKNKQNSWNRLQIMKYKRRIFSNGNQSLVSCWIFKMAKQICTSAFFALAFVLCVSSV